MDFHEDTSPKVTLKQNPSFMSVLLVVTDTALTNESHLPSAASCGREHESPFNLPPDGQTTVMWSDWKTLSLQPEMESEMECVKS